MQTVRASRMTVRLELFVDDLTASLDFYSRVLGFEIGEGQPDGYTALTNGEVRIGLNLRANLPDDHPVQSSANERLGRGVELVLEVADVEDVQTGHSPKLAPGGQTAAPALGVDGLPVVGSGWILSADHIPIDTYPIITRSR